MGGTKTRTHSRIDDELPVDIRAQINRLLVETNATYDDIKDFLDKKGFDISRSAIGRYGKGFMSNYQRLRIIEDKSRTLVSEAGDGLVLEETAAKMFASQIIEAQLNGEIDMKTLVKLIGGFAALQSSSVQRERIKKEISQKAEKAVQNIEKRAAKKTSLDPETLKIIKEEVYGIV